MPTTTYFGQTYVSPLDPAYADLWGSVYNTLHTFWDSAVGRSQISMPILYPLARTYQLITKSRKPGTIKSLTAKTDAGTLTAAVKINGIAVTGLSAVAVTSSEADSTASAANTFAAGDDIQMTLSSVSGVTEFDFNIWIDLSGAGTA